MTDIRKGMWVKHDTDIMCCIGIVAAISGNTAEVHIVDDRGNTVVVMPRISITELEQAALADIPQARRPTAETAAGLGYK